MSDKITTSLLDPVPELWKYPSRRSKRFQNLRTEEENLADLNNLGHDKIAEDFSDSPFHKKQT